MGKPFIRLDDVELEIERTGIHFEVKFKFEADSAFQIFGPTMSEEYDSPTLRHTIIGGVRDALAHVLPSILEEEGFNKHVRSTLYSGITSEPYLMSTLGFYPKRKLGPAQIFPPSGAFIDVDLRLEDEFAFVLVAGRRVRFIFDDNSIETPSRFLMAETKQADYGYIPAKQGKSGISVHLKSCPNKKKSPKKTKTAAFCMVNNPFSASPYPPPGPEHFAQSAHCSVFSLHSA